MISVNISVYKVGFYLFAYLDSILGYSFADFELMCVVDVLSDFSLDILYYFAKRDTRINIIRNETNWGNDYSINLEFETSKDKYISFLDGDDFLSHDVSEILVKIVKKDSFVGIMFKNIGIAKIVSDYFIKKLELCDYYKIEVLNYMFNSLFYGKYHQRGDNLKEKFYSMVCTACRLFINQYDLYEDITENVNYCILKFFRFYDLRWEDD